MTLWQEHGRKYLSVDRNSVCELSSSNSHLPIHVNISAITQVDTEYRRYSWKGLTISNSFFRMSSAYVCAGVAVIGINHLDSFGQYIVLHFTSDLYVSRTMRYAMKIVFHCVKWTFVFQRISTFDAETF